MSLPNVDILKPRQETNLDVKSADPEDFTTATLSKMCSMQFGGWGVGARIINNDATNVLVYRLHSNRGTARTIPISSEITVNQWFDILILEPNGTTGAGQLELDYVLFKDARRLING